LEPRWTHPARAATHGSGNATSGWQPLPPLERPARLPAGSRPLQRRIGFPQAWGKPGERCEPEEGLLRA
jgi:hypothetical protein